MGLLLKIEREEMRIQEEIETKLSLLQWYVKRIHGSIYQSGLPDLYLCHVKYGARWLEIKHPERYSFTEAQMTEFPKITARRIGIWIAQDPRDVPDILHKPANWHLFLSVMKARGRRG